MIMLVIHNRKAIPFLYRFREIDNIENLNNFSQIIPSLFARASIDRIVAKNRDVNMFK